MQIQGMLAFPSFHTGFFSEADTRFRSFSKQKLPEMTKIQNPQFHCPKEKAERQVKHFLLYISGTRNTELEICSRICSKHYLVSISERRIIDVERKIENPPSNMFNNFRASRA
jgi:hypothetical protein